MLSYRLQSDDGFMGNTHALSVAAVVLSLAAFLPTIFFKLTTSKDVIVLVAALVIALGAGLLPDLDNTTSSAISTLGPIGSALSFIMRITSEGMYAISHTGKEPSESDPHRGFWHTAFAGIILGIVTMLLMKFNTQMFKINGNKFSFATLLLFILILIGFELAITGLFGKQTRKLRNSITGPLVLWLIGIVFSLLIIFLMPTLKSYTWVGVMVIIGYVTHILGDTLTTSGTPILWPLSHNGKRWWSYRLPPHIHADGPTEHHIFLPLFAAIVIIAIIKLAIGGV